MSDDNSDSLENCVEKMSAQIDEIHRRLTIVENLLKDLAPGFERFLKETSATLYKLRERYERDETLMLVEKIGDSIPTFIEILDMMNAMRGFLNDFRPSIQKIVEEVTPTVHSLRNSLEKDEIVDLLIKTGENSTVFNMLLDCFSGTEVQWMIKGMEASTIKSVKELQEKTLKSGTRNLFSPLKDPEMQKSFIFLMILTRNLLHGLTEAVDENSKK